MTRFIFLLTLLLVLSVSTPRAALAHNEEPIRTEKIQVGPYVVTAYYYAPPISQQPITLVLIPDAPVEISAEVRPLSDAEALPEPLAVQPDPEHGPDAIALGWTPSMGGAWEMTLHLDGAQGSATAPLDIEVAPPVLVPHWLAWLVGLSPLYALTWFLASEIQRVRATLQPLGGRT